MHNELTIYHTPYQCDRLSDMCAFVIVENTFILFTPFYVLDWGISVRFPISLHSMMRESHEEECFCYFNKRQHRTIGVLQLPEPNNPTPL